MKNNPAQSGNGKHYRRIHAVFSEGIGVNPEGIGVSPGNRTLQMKAGMTEYRHVTLFKS